MAKSVYLVKTKAQRNVPKNPAGLRLSVIPGIIYSQLIAQHYLTNMTAGSRMAATMLVIISYLLLSRVPYICIAVAAANTVMYVGMIWFFLGKIEAPWLCILLKGITALMLILIEIGICAGVMQKRKHRY